MSNQTNCMKTKEKFSIRNLLIRIVLIIFAIIVLLPIVWTIFTSFKTSTEFFADPWALPSSFYWKNYINAINKGNMGAYFMNSIFITLLSILFMIVLSIPLAYVLTRFKFKLSKTLSLILMGGLFVSQSYIVVPISIMLNKAESFLNQYVIFQNLQLSNNLVVLALVYAVTTLPFTSYLLSGFFRTIPRDYEEAASIDGCGYFGTLFRIIVPMAQPAMITVVMFNFMNYWNEYPLSLTILKQNNWTLPVGLQNLMEQQKFATDWGAMFAGMVLVMTPTIILYCLVQKKLTQGITMGGLKG